MMCDLHYDESNQTIILDKVIDLVDFIEDIQRFFEKRDDIYEWEISPVDINEIYNNIDSNENDFDV